MKKSFFLAAAVLAAVSVCGCGNGAADKEKTDNGGVADVGKYVTLSDYKGLSVSVDSTVVTDEEIEQAEKNALSSISTKEAVTDRAVENGDTVNIDYEGKKDGVAFDGGTAQGYDLEIGSGTFIDGFEDGLIGAEIGETRDLNLTFPENYASAELAGQDVVFTVKVNSISEDKVPELTDAVAKELDSDVSGADEYREKLKEALQVQKTASAKAKAYADLLAEVQESSEIASGDDLPKWLIEENKESQKESFEKSLQMYGLDLSTYLSQQGMSEADFDETLEAYAQTIAEQQLLIQALAEAENISVTDADIDAQYEEDASTYGYDSAEEFKEAVKEQGQEKTFEEATLTRKVEEMLFKYAKVENPEMVNW